MDFNRVDNFDGLDEPVRQTPRGRKRRLNIENHKKQQQKKARYSGGALIPAVGCKHSAATVFCQAEKLSSDDLMLNFSKFYENPNKVEQDRALLHLMSITPVKRQRPKVQNEEKRKDRNLSVRYSLLCNSHPEKVPVCKSTFIEVLGECFISELTSLIPFCFSLVTKIFFL